jgi:hypothetical protein
VQANVEGRATTTFTKKHNLNVSIAHSIVSDFSRQSNKGFAEIENHVKFLKETAKDPYKSVKNFETTWKPR